MQCRQPIAIRAIQFVGVAQSLNYDAIHDVLIVTGVDAANGPNPSPSNLTHTVIKITPDQARRVAARSRGPTPRCGAVDQIGSFGLDAQYFPLLHGSGFDPKRQKLYIGLAAAQSTDVIGEYSLTTGELTRIDAETGNDSLVGMAFNPATNCLVGVSSVSSGYDGAQLRTFNLSSGSWLPPVNLPSSFSAAGANDGEAHAFDAVSGVLYCFLYGPPTDPSSTPPLMLVAIAAASGSVVSATPAGPAGMCRTDASCVVQLAFAGP